MSSGGSHAGVAPRPVQSFRRGGRASAAPEAVASATVKEAGRLGPGQERWSRVPTHSRAGAQVWGMASRPNRRASSFYSTRRPSHPRGHCLSPHQLSPPRALRPSEDLHSGRVRYPGGRVHTAPQGCSASLSSCVSLAPKTAGPGLHVSGEGCRDPVL